MLHLVLRYTDLEASDKLGVIFIKLLVCIYQCEDFQFFWLREAHVVFVFLAFYCLLMDLQYLVVWSQVTIEKISSRLDRLPHSFVSITILVVILRVP